MKNWYTSKTLWLNLIAVIVLVVQTQTGFVIDPETQAGLLAVINLVLRAITGTTLSWSTNPSTLTDESGRIHIPLLFLLITFTCLMLLTSGCATTIAAGTAKQDTPLQTAGKSLLAVKSGIVTAATATASFCQLGTIGAEKCGMAQDAYAAAKPAYDLALESYLLMSTGGGDPADFGAALLRVQNLAASLLLITSSNLDPAGAQ